MTNTDPSRMPRPSGRFGWPLIASVALNVFFLGLSLGALINRPPLGPPPSLTERIDGRLSAAGAARIAQRLRIIDGAMSEGNETFDAVHREMRRVAGTEPFDGAVLATVLDRLSATRTTQERRLSGLIVDMLRDLDATDRNALIEALLPPLRPSSGPRMEPPKR